MAISPNTILACTRVVTPKARGSATVLYSKPNTKGEYSTYLLTNQHVVENVISHEMRWNNVLKRDIKTELLGVVDIHFFEYAWEQRTTALTSYKADIMAYDKVEDLALVKLRSMKPVGGAALLYPKGHEQHLRIGEPVFAIGAALGEPPILTKGALARYGFEIEGREFWLQTAPTIFGNSGGAVFLEDTEEFIGVPARVATSGWDDVITHMSFMIPITRVYQFIDKQMFRFIYDSTFTEEGEEKGRESRRKQDEKKTAHDEAVGEQENTERDLS